MIEPTPNIERVVSPNGPDYFALYGGEDANIAAVRYTHCNVVRIEPHGEGGIVTGDPEDVRWFARRLLELADRMESVTEPETTA